MGFTGSSGRPTRCLTSVSWRLSSHFAVAGRWNFPAPSSVFFRLLGGPPRVSVDLAASSISCEMDSSRALLIFAPLQSTSLLFRPGRVFADRLSWDFVPRAPVADITAGTVRCGATFAPPSTGFLGVHSREKVALSASVKASPDALISFRPGGFAPLRRFTPPFASLPKLRATCVAQDSWACCIPLPILGFAALVPAALDSPRRNPAKMPYCVAAALAFVPLLARLLETSRNRRCQLIRSFPSHRMTSTSRPCSSSWLVPPPDAFTPYAGPSSWVFVPSKVPRRTRSRKSAPRLDVRPTLHCRSAASQSLCWFQRSSPRLCRYSQRFARRQT